MSSRFLTNGVKTDTQIKHLHILHIPQINSLQLRSDAGAETNSARQRSISFFENLTNWYLPKPRSEPTEALQFATARKERKGGRIISVISKVVFGTAEPVQTLVLKHLA